MESVEVLGSVFKRFGYARENYITVKLRHIYLENNILAHYMHV